VAHLTGSVKRPIDRYDAVLIASATEGVKSVRDDLQMR
jgi:osmotically-inducible protein OsmY